MIARFAGGVLGLLAFSVAAVLGLVAGNPPMTIVTRSIWALVVFCVLGLVVGAAAQAVVNDFVGKQEEAPRSTKDDAAEAGTDSAERTAPAEQSAAIE